MRTQATPTTASLVVLAMVGALLVGGVRGSAGASPAEAAPRELSVPGRAVPVAAAAPDPESDGWRGAPAPVWPAARTVTLAADGRAPAGFPVRLTSAGGTVASASGAAGPGPAPAAAAPTEPGPVTASVLDQRTVSTLDAVGLAVRLGPRRGPVTMSVDYAPFRYAAGGNLADRLRLVRLPDCAADRPADPGCASATAVEATNDTAAGRLTASVAAGDSAVFALVSAASGESGDYRSTDLRPSGKWSVGLQSGSFQYSYPLTLPVPPYGKAPDLSLRYSSGSVDGRTSASNNQASWVGLGWDLNPGYIERRYRYCPDDGQSLLSDLCWHSPYSADEDGAAYVISLAGTTTELLRAADGTYRMRSDQGWKIEHRFDGQNSDNSKEYWIVTTLDGTKYRMGYREDANWNVPVVGDDAGEPCHGSAWCRQTWRWSLDQITDPNGNLTNLLWTKESNHYERWNSTTRLGYDRGGYLDRVEYGMRTGERPMVQVDFTAGYRCASDIALANPDCAAPTSSSGEGEYPDVPRDLICASGQDCAKPTPTFFVARRLTGVVTRVWDPVTAAYLEVNRYQPTYSFVNPSGPTDPQLWLNTIQMSGRLGDAVTMPVVDFDGVWLNNRVDYPTGDLPKAMPFRRLATIRNGLGGETRITYGHASAAATCPSNGADSTWEGGKHWDTNTQECYRQEFKPEGGSKTKGVFHKYLTTKVQQVDLVGGSPTQTTTYEYVGAAAWHHDDDLVLPADRQLWTDWRGYPTVRTTEGTGPNEQRAITESTFFRGMDGDKLTSGTRDVTVTDYGDAVFDDNHAKVERLLQERKFRLNADGTRTEVESVRHTYWDSGITANGPGLHNAHIIQQLDTRSRDRRADGTWRDTSTTADGHSTANGGQPTRKVDWGVPGLADDLCTELRYAQNTTLWLLSSVESEELHGGPPDAQSGECPGPVVKRTVTLYDGATAPGPSANRPTRGNPTDTRKYWNDTSFASERKSYDAYGRVTSVTNPVNATTTTSYNPVSGWPVNGVVTTNPFGHSTTEYLSRAWGKPVKTVDANGKVVSQDYDGAGRLRRVWQQTEPKPTGPEVPPPTGATPSYEFTYRLTFAGTGQPTKPIVVTTKRFQAQLASGPQFLTSHTYLDGLGRVREVQEPSPGPAGGRMVTVTTYDDRGLARASTEPMWNATAAADNPDLMLNPARADVPSWTETAYDALGRETSATLYGAGQVKAVTATANYGDGKVVTPPRGGRTAFWNDARDRLALVQENVPAGNDVPPAGVATTRYTYTQRGELATMVDAVNNRTEYVTDWLGRRTSAKDPDAGIATTTYDPTSNVTSVTNASGTKISFSYDPLGRKRVEWAGDVGGAKIAEWTFDTLPGAKGQPVAEIRYANGQAYTEAVTGYDPRYRATGRMWTIPAIEGGLAGSYQYGYAYDRADHQVSMTYPAVAGLSAETVVTGYTGTGLPSTLSSDLAASVYVRSTAYDGSGALTSRVYGGTGSVERRFGYEPTGARRLSAVETVVNGSRVQHDTLAYDAADNLMTVTDTTVAQSQCYGYDALQRLTQSWTTTAADCSGGITAADGRGPDPYRVAYTVDAVGNLRSVSNNDTVTTYSYPAAGDNAIRPHAVSAVGADTFGYDAQGQLTSRTVAGRTATLGWDAAGRLSSVTSAGTTTTNVYDADGDRLVRRDQDAATLYLDGTELRVTGSVATATRYYLHDDTLVAARTSTGTLTWLGNDAQGTVQVAVDATTKAVSRQRYLPFGAHRGGRDDIAATDRGFVGKVEDPTGLVQMGARYYDPVIGKFISTDPIYDTAKPQSLNPYAYAFGNPLKYSDPTGLFPFPCFVCLINSIINLIRSWINAVSRPRTPGSVPGHCVGIECTKSLDPPAPAPPKPKPAPKPAPAPAPDKNTCTVTPNTSGAYPAARTSGCGGLGTPMRPVTQFIKGVGRVCGHLGVACPQIVGEHLLAPIIGFGWPLAIAAGVCAAVTAGWCAVAIGVGVVVGVGVSALITRGVYGHFYEEGADASRRPHGS